VPRLAIVHHGECLVKHCLPSLSEAIKDKSKAKTRIPFLWQCFLSLQNHAPQILETACKYDKDHNQTLCKPQHVYYKNVGNGDEIWIVPLNFIPWKIGKEQTRVTLKELNTAKLN
jgi:hypothetical protein